MLLEGGSVRGKLSYPLNVLDILTVAKPILFQGGRKAVGQGFTKKHNSVSRRLHNLPAIAPCFWIVVVATL